MEKVYITLVRLLGSSSSRLEPHIDIELGSYFDLLLIHHLCSSSVLFLLMFRVQRKGWSALPVVFVLCWNWAARILGRGSLVLLG